MKSQPRKNMLKFCRKQMISMMQSTENYTKEERRLQNRIGKSQFCKERSKIVLQKLSFSNITRDSLSCLNPSITSLKRIKDMLLFTTLKKWSSSFSFSKWGTFEKSKQNFKSAKTKNKKMSFLEILLESSRLLLRILIKLPKISII